MALPLKPAANNTSRKTAVGYIRCSTDMQADTSPEQQKRIINEWALNNNLDIVRWYEDAGKSGTSFDKRPAFMQLKRDAQDRRDFQSIIALDESRWGRAGAKESIFYKMYFEKIANIEVRLVRTIASTGNEVIDTMLEAFEGGLSREESKKKSERCLDGGINASLKGWSAGGTAPYGYKRVATNKFTSEKRTLGMIFTQDGVPLLNEKGLPMFEQRKPKEEYVLWELGEPVEVETVRRIFDWSANQGFGYTKIAKLLNSMNIECPRRGRWRNIDSKWSASTVGEIVRNLSYTGARVYNRNKRRGIGKFAQRYKQTDQACWIIVENAHPAIVSKEVWIAINSVAKSRFGKVNRFTQEGPYLLSGLIRCSHCQFAFTGRKMLSGRTGHRKPKLIYNDSGYSRKGPSVCSSLNIDKEGIESFILECVREYLLSSDIQARLQLALAKKLEGVFPDIDDRQKEVEQKMTECGKKISALLSLVEKGVNVDTIANRIKALEDEKDSLKREIKELRNQNVGKEEFLDLANESMRFVEDYVSSFDDLTLAEKKAGMKKLVKQIIVDREKRVAHCHIRTIPPFKQHPLLEALQEPSNLFSHKKRRDDPVVEQQLRSSLVGVPPTRFELVYRA
jgi:site-specific DNA recombinase